MKKVYLDNAASTPLLPEVIDVMVNCMKNSFGNPSSIHSFGQEAKGQIEEVRRSIAQYLKVTPGEIIFTSCGTESNNMIIKSSVYFLGVERIITSPLEHKCVAESVMEMKRKNNVELVLLKPDSKGDLDFSQLETLLKSSDKKTLVSLMHANNEVGNIIDIKKVGQICKDHNALFHCDTVQTVAHFNLDFSDIPVDFASSSAHKFHGPKGVGFAFIRKNSGLKPLIIGGGQERALRAGTENVPGIVGMGKAMDLCMQHLDEHAEYIQGIKDYCIEQLKSNIPGVRFNGRSAERDHSLYTVLSVLLPFKDPMIGFELDMKGIAISQGSACSSGAAKPSMVMMCLLNDEEMESCTPLRLSFSQLTTKEDIDQLITALEEIAAKHVIEKTNH